MPEGFFSSASLIVKTPLRLVPQCGACQLSTRCKSPKMPVDGKGRRKILIVGESPGETEDEEGIPFIGPAGQRLQTGLAKAGIDLREDCWITNAIICHPGKEAPTDKQIGFCQPNVIKAIRELKPDIIIPLGGPAVQSVIGSIWKDDPGKIMRWAGWQIPCQKPNAWITPTFHPSYCLRADDPVVDLFFDKHLKAAGKLTGKPWEKVPNYIKEVQRIIAPNAAANGICKFHTNGKPIAWDIETTTLKPDSEAAEIVCCSVSDGETTIAYPWHGEAITATLELLKSDVPKIQWNLKFEVRWLKAKHGVTVRNIIWDGMQAAHVLDNRPGVSGLKFQAFALLGQTSYDDHIKPYLESKDGRSNTPNRIREADLDAILLYCGLDSKMEYEISMKQMELVGHKL